MRRLQDDGLHSPDDAGDIRAEALSHELIQMGMPAITFPILDKPTHWALHASKAAFFRFLPVIRGMPLPHRSTSKRLSRLLEIKIVVTR